MTTIADLEALDGYAALRNGLRRIAEMQDNWAGLPMPLEDLPLVIEPHFPMAKELSALNRPDEGDVRTIRNAFWSDRWRSEVVIWEEDGKIVHGVIPRVHGLPYALGTLGAADAWGIEQESRALLFLAELLPHRKFKQYVLTGSFLEHSARSCVTYLFRRLRPTVAMSMRGKNPRPLCALCLHPIGYYEGSWAGAMTPTDDVVAHLMLMRADEHMFWKRSNQHPLTRPEAGL